MFRTRSNYINVDNSYTDIRNKLHRAYQEKGANARVRFVEGRGLYIKNEKADWRKSRDSDKQKNERQEKFTNARDTLIAAIDREYNGWSVDGQSMGRYVLDNLSTPFNFDEIDEQVLEELDEQALEELKKQAFKGLDEQALKDIDALIAEGMQKVITALTHIAENGAPERSNSSREARGRIQEARERNAIFQELKSAREEEASRNRVQRWWAKYFGDNHLQVKVDRALDRARNWRAIVHGNRLLAEAIAEDLQGADFVGDLQATSREILKELKLLRTGLTPDSHKAVRDYLGARGYASDAVQQLGSYVDLTQNAKTNINRLRRLNSGIDHICRMTDFSSANGPILDALNACDYALFEAERDLNTGILTREGHCTALYNEFRQSFQFLCEARRALAGVTRTPQNAQAYDRLTGLIDEHLVVTHDFACAVLKVGKDDLDGHSENFRLPIKEGVNLIADFAPSSLVAALPQPKKIFQSTARKMNGEAMPETSYNDACGRVSEALNKYKTALSGRRVEAQLKYLGKLRRRVAQASRLNDQFVIVYGRQAALGGSAHPAVNNHLQDQRADLQMLNLRCVQERLRLDKEQVRTGRRRDRNPLESDSASSVSNKHTQKFINPRPGLRSLNRCDSSNDDLSDEPSSGVFSNNAGGNESLLSFDDDSNNASSSIDQERHREYPIEAVASKARQTTIEPAAKKVVSAAFDSLPNTTIVADYVNYPEDVESHSGVVQSDAGGVSVVSWGPTRSTPQSDNSPPQNMQEPEFDASGPQYTNDQFTLYNGALSNAWFPIQLDLPLSGLPEHPVDQYVRQSTFDDQPQFQRTVSTETAGDEPAPGLFPETSQVSYISDPSTANSLNQLRLDLNTTTVNTLTNEVSNQFENKINRRSNMQNSDNKYDAGHLQGLDFSDKGGFTYLYEDPEYNASDNSEPTEASSSEMNIARTPEPDELNLSNGGEDSTSVQNRTPETSRKARFSKSSRS
ncbi:MAG: hypothetical protein AAGC95_01430 [Pseudomonadota bacterium]